jgi:glycosyltransferase involved in cell wall biosynthesis
MISLANALDRAGDRIGAMRAYLNYYRESAADSPLKKIALDNIRRIVLAGAGVQDDEILGELLLAMQDRKIDLTRENITPAAATGPKVTLIVPCYNVESYLEACVESIRRQTLKSFECILVDDFSKDSTPSIAKAIAQSDKRFRFFQHRANGGLAAARNTGLRLSRGRYVAFLDSDDLLARESLERRANVLARYDCAAQVAGVFDLSQTIDHEFSGEIDGKEARYKTSFVDFVTTQGDCPFNANQPMIKRTVLVDMGGFPESYPQAEDWRLWSKVMRAGYIFLPVQSIGSGYRQTPGSLIRREPLLHVRKSVRNYYRAHQRYDAELEAVEQRYEKTFFAAPLFMLEAGFYKAQGALLSRVVTFFGIEIARLQNQCGRQVDLDVLFAILDEAIPDRAVSVGSVTPKTIRTWLENGSKRYYGGTSTTPDVKDRFESICYAFIGRLYGSKVALFIGVHAMPSRPLVRRDALVVDILFLPHKAYHTKSFQLLMPLLDRAGLTYRIVDLAVPYRDEGAFVSELKEHFISYNEFVLSRLLPRVIVCMNDWDTVVKPVIVAAKRRGIETVGIVEGVQDYRDEDTGRIRNAYREVAHVFLPGSFDRQYFASTSQSVWVTGVQRLDGLARWRHARAGRAASAMRVAVVNVNFSYGVMTDRRSTWLADVAMACETAGYQMIVSQHPQDGADLSGYEVSDRPLYDLMVDADCLISRFSGAILESLVIGCPVVYYNGHGEKVDKFHDSLGGYLVADTPSALVDALKSGLFVSANPSEFLLQHCDLNPADSRSSVEKTVCALVELSHRSQPTLADMAALKMDLGF